jgi:hypothetical protein
MPDVDSEFAEARLLKNRRSTQKLQSGTFACSTTRDAPHRRDSHHCRACRTTALRRQAPTGLDRTRENPPELFQLRGSIFLPKGMPQRSGKVWRHLFLTMQVGRQCPMGPVQTDSASQQAMNGNPCRTAAAIGGEKSVSRSLRSATVMASDIKFPPPRSIYQNPEITASLVLTPPDRRHSVPC